MRERIENKDNPLDGLPQETEEQLRNAVKGYLEGHPGFVEILDKELDDILSRLVEKGAELSPDVKRSLRKAAHFLLGIILEKEK